MKHCFTLFAGVPAEENASHWCWSKKAKPANYPPFSFDSAGVSMNSCGDNKLCKHNFYSSVDSSFHIKHYILYTGNNAQKEIQKCTYIYRYILYIYTYVHLCMSFLHYCQC